jgi:anti-anti-sigma factor
MGRKELKRCPQCETLLPDNAQRCSHCDRQFTLEDLVKAVIEAEPGPDSGVETCQVPGHADIFVVKIVGHCDHSLTQKLNKELKAVRDRSPVAVIFDLSRVPQMFSMCLSLLVAFAAERGGKKSKSMAVVNVREHVMQVILNMGLQGYLPIHDTVRDALSSMETP